MLIQITKENPIGGFYLYKYPVILNLKGDQIRTASDHIRTAKTMA